MRKIILILAGLLMTITITCQTTIYNNLVIQKATPLFHLSGNGGTISFYNGDIILVQSANTLTLSGGNFALGANNFYLTGQIGQTGSRVSKIWATDLELTNAPTIGGVSFTSTFAPINNPTFLGTVVLPTTTSIGLVSSTELGYLNNATSEIQAQINTKAPTNNPTLTGNVGLPATTTIAGSTVPEIINDTVEARILAADEISDLVPMLVDSTVTYVTPTQMYSYSGGGGTTGKFYYLSGNVDDTGFPAAGDTSVTHTNFPGKHITFIREGQIQQQHADNTTQDGFWLDNILGIIRVRPAFGAGEQVEIWTTNTIQWETLTTEGGGGPAPSTLLTGLRAGWKLDEVSGNTAYDVLGTYNGITTGTVNQPGPWGVAESFTTNQYTDFGQTVGDLGTGDFSVSLWFRVPSLPGDEQGIVGTCCDAPTFYVTTTATNYIMGVFNFSGADLVFYSDAAITALTWYHLSVTVDRSGNAIMYLNGVAQADTEDISAEVAVTMTSNKYFYIGRAGGDYFNGTIDDVYLHTKVLSPAEVLEAMYATYPWN